MRETLYRGLLWWYPGSFRRRYGEELVDAFRDMWLAEVGGAGGGIASVEAEARLWGRLVRDAVVGGVWTRLSRTRAPAGPYGAREAVGVAGWLAGVGGDARQAGRVLWRSPGFAAVVVVMLALGVGASTAVFTVLHDVLLRPLPYPASDRLVRLYMAYEDDRDSRTFLTGTHFLGYREGLTSLDGLVPLYTYAETGADVRIGDRPERVRTLSVGAEYFDVLGVAPRPGRAFTREEERPGVRLAVVSERLAARLVPDASAGSDGGSASGAGSGSDADAGADSGWVVGKSLTLGGEPHTVVGVMPASFEDPLVGAVDVWVPQDMVVTDSTNQPYNHYLSAIGRLAPGVPLERARAEVDAVAARLAEEYPDQSATRAALVPLHEDLVGRARPMLLVLFGAVGVVLLVVCVNVANLFLVRSLERRRELAVRLALGSGGARLGRQLLLESLALAAVGGALGVILAWVGVSALPVLAGDAVPRLREVQLSGGVLAFAVAVTAAAGVAFGLAPAVRFARPDLSGELRDRRSGGGRATSRMRAGLVVAQVALSLVLLAGSGILVASFQRLRDVDLGFRPEGAATFEVHLPVARYAAGADRARFHDALADRLGALPGVTAAGAINRLPATGVFYSWGTRPVTGPLAGEEDSFIGGNQRVVEGAVFDALGIEIVAGRRFDARDDADAPSRYVISRDAADKLFPGIDPLGQTLSAGGREGEVIGVAEDAVAGVEGRIVPVIYHHHRQFADGRNWAMTYVVRSAGAGSGAAAGRGASGAADNGAAGDPLAVVPRARAALAEMDPGLVLFRPEPLDRVVGQGRADRRFALSLMLGFAAIALTLAALGLYAVLGYAVAQRRHEIGVRMAVGATAGEIRRVVLGQGLALAGLGAAVGLVAALGVSRWLEALVFEVSVRDPRVLGLVTVLVLLVAALAGWIPARRATRVDPRVVLEEG